MATKLDKMMARMDRKIDNEISDINDDIATTHKSFTKAMSARK